MGYPTAVFPSDMRKPQGSHMKRGKVYMCGLVIVSQ